MTFAKRKFCSAGYPAISPAARSGERIWPHRKALSWPISVHGVGTVRHWAAMKLSIVPCRHNVSARDGGIPASRTRFGMARPGQRAGLGLPANAQLLTFIVHSKTHLTRPADAAVLTAGHLPPLHRPAPAAGLTSFPYSVETRQNQTNQIEIKLKQAEKPLRPL